MNTRKKLLMGNLGLLLILVVVAAKMVWLPLRLHKSLEPTAVLAQDFDQGLTEPQLPKTTDHQNLASSAMFGPVENAQTLTTEPRSQPTLDHLLLLGTVTGPEHIARAFIKNKTTETSQIYKLHDWIDEAQLTQVSRNEVVLERHNQSITLLRTREASPSALAAPSDSQVTKAVTPVNQPTPTGRNNFTEDVEVVLKAAAISSTSPTNPEQSNGITLSRIDRFLSAQAAGFQEGDVIHAINGHEIMSKQQMFQVLQKAKTQELIDIEIFREGKLILLSFEQG